MRAFSIFMHRPGNKDPNYRYFSDISERNNDYSDTLDFIRGPVGEVGVVTFFVSEVTDYESAMLIWVVLQKLSHFKFMKF